MPVYTKRGDRGETSMYDPGNQQMRRVSKDSLRVWAIGSVDEVNSYLGVTLAFCSDKKLTVRLQRIQKDLFTVGSTLAGAKLPFSITKVNYLEREIDSMEEQLPVLKNFILPGGEVLSSHLQFTRALTRRAERRIVALSKAEDVKPTVLQYINRLSDYFFVLARYINLKNGSNDILWKKS